MSLNGSPARKRLYKRSFNGAMDARGLPSVTTLILLAISSLIGAAAIVSGALLLPQQFQRGELLLGAGIVAWTVTLVAGMPLAIRTMRIGGWLATPSWLGQPRASWLVAGIGLLFAASNLVFALSAPPTSR